MIKSPYELSKKFSKDGLRDQFLISSDAEHGPVSWRRVRIHDYVITHSPNLPCSIIEDDDGKPAGYCIGQYMTSLWQMYGELRISWGTDFETGIDQFLGCLTGRFVVVLKTPAGLRIYLDPCGSRSVVYSPHEKVAATSPTLIPYGEKTGDDSASVDAMDISNRNAMYPLGMTARNGVYRLLPGHYLDLSRWKPSRHWPRREPEEITDVPTAIDEIAMLLRRVIETVGRRHGIQIALTAGQDSRMILSCSKEWARKVKYFTHRIPDQTGELDCYLASKICKKMSLDHRVIPTLHASVEEKEYWLFQTGYSVGERRGLDAVPMVKMLEPDRVYLPGYVCELGRAYYWSRTGVRPNADKREIDPETLLKICNAPITEKMLRYAVRWLDEIPVHDSGRVMDLFYLEQRLGCWAGAMMPGYAGMSLFELWPANNRRIIELILRLPAEYKRAANLNPDVIGKTWPELLRFPINTGDWGYRIYSAVTNPRRTAGKILRRLRPS